VVVGLHMWVSKLCEMGADTCSQYSLLLFIIFDSDVTVGASTFSTSFSQFNKENCGHGLGFLING